MLTTLWASVSCSSTSSDIVCISTGDKISYLPRFSAAMTSGFLNRMNWLKYASPCKILDLAELPVIIFHEHYEFYIILTCVKLDSTLWISSMKNYNVANP